MITSNTNSFHLLRDKNYRSNKRDGSGSNKLLKSHTVGGSKLLYYNTFLQQKKKELLEKVAMYCV